MKITRTKYESYSLRDFDVAEGCKLCVEGKKLVLFVTGLCPRNCFYCSLSNKRKNKDEVWANERLCHNVEDAITEAKESNSEGAGITGGDPLTVLERTIEYAKSLKKEFKNFHIHIYLPTDNVTKQNLEKLSHYIDEVRFHPYFLQTSLYEKELEKIKLASLFWKKNQIGVELPLLPDKVKETSRFIEKVLPYIGFVNLNELEISDSNFEYITKNYEINEDTYTIKGSLKIGKKILKNFLQKEIKMHLCTGKTKSFYQYKNRLLRKKIFPFGYRTREGSVRYFVVYLEDMTEKEKEKIKNYKEIYFDEPRKRYILSEKVANKLKNQKFKIARVEELPTYDATQLQFEYV
ncbi:MAG: 4Fe-4S cluster-binding domain-containing protein [Candidatus Pacearchaeota archaeon]|nr:4Fe-4S cluster-binding domain-containing protein [Candidatus Pacearchaeota archaeon]